MMTTCDRVDRRRRRRCDRDGLTGPAPAHPARRGRPHGPPGSVSPLPDKPSTTLCPLHTITRCSRDVLHLSAFSIRLEVGVTEERRVLIVGPYPHNSIDPARRLGSPLREEDRPRASVKDGENE
jgi:hypothetical protein